MTGLQDFGSQDGQLREFTTGEPNGFVTRFLLQWVGMLAAHNRIEALQSDSYGVGVVIGRID
jgi:hypothetical protein